ncbi:hypothetical protein [Aporhodopirellula aestuarii]|uniref:Uncharacterized protein n=1 Tax=Aporhodopirellula aestuarii TaxID=2950107 RepID=A0ABT0U3I5_9BACT|nr:hypothetical protein [Aporhodopirellula aestuarii]MCM2371465.1 hypothetical protein [Aporhodopirellula aestuarii]
MTLTSTAPSPRKRSNKSAKRAITPDFGVPVSADQWETLQSELENTDLRSRSAAKYFGQDAAGGAIYLWGMATAMHGPTTVLQQKLAELATRVDGEGGQTSDADQEMLATESQRLIDRVFNDEMSGIDAAETILWAAAMPSLSRILPREVWWHCGEQLMQIRADAALRSDATSPLHLLLAGELGLTLAWGLGGLPSCQALVEPAVEAVTVFLEGEGESIDRSVTKACELRLIVASLVRCERLFPLVSKRKFKKRAREIAAEFATWMAALARHDGTQVFSYADADECDVDCMAYSSAADSSSKTRTRRKTSSRVKASQNELHGLMKAASDFDNESLTPALAAALGQSHSGGQLAWEVSLPEAMWHSEAGKTLAMLPQWDVRRGRTFVDYSAEDVRVELTAGRQSILTGEHQTMIRVNGVDQQPDGEWECTCEYTDDDVHLIEIEQPFTGGVVLQRQWMLVRDDCCVMVSDAVLPRTKKASDEVSAVTKTKSGEPEPAPEIVCVSRLPLAPGVEVVEDDETRELLLMSGNKRRALLMPLAANEWRVGPSACQVTVSEDRHLVVTTSGQGAVYSPVWLDLQPRRARRKRTWRQLTVAENLSIIPRNVAAGFRVQTGSEHWVVYRSMSAGGPRSVMGKHLIADFFAARFHPGDGGMEELVTVDDTSGSE